MKNRLFDTLNIRHVLFRRYLTIALQLLKQEGLRAFLGRVYTRFAPVSAADSGPKRQFHLEDALSPLTLECSLEPLISVVIPCYGQPLHTYTCLKSLAAVTAEAAMEIILVDDASPEPLAESLSGISGVVILCLRENSGFISACNAGAQRARGKYLLFLNNDTLVLPHALTALLELIERWPGAELVGPKLIYQDGSLQEAGGILWQDGSAWNYGRGDDTNRPEYNYVREVDYLSGACLMLRRELFHELGGFDPAYAPAYYEDADLACKVREAGGKVMYQPVAEVVHFEGVSCGSATTSGMKRHQLLNQKRFQGRWAATLARHAPNGMRIEHERERYVGQRILVIDAYVCTPDKDSGSLRMWEMLALLRELGCKVCFIPLDLKSVSPYVEDLQQQGIEVLYAPHLTSIKSYLNTHGGLYDQIILSRLTSAKRFLEALAASRPGPRLIFDTVDLHFLREERYAELSGKYLDRTLARETRQLELHLIELADTSLVVSAYEQELLQKELPGSDIRTLSNIHQVFGCRGPFDMRRDALFVGGFRHPPNTDAVQFLAQEILPLVVREIPDFRVYIIGSHMPAPVKRLASDRLIMLGYVEDLEPFLDSCRMSLAPLRYGAGVKGKVNLSMSYGLPVVATAIGVEGMHLTPGEDALVVDTAEAFAAAIVRLNRDQALWEGLSANGLDNVERYFSRDAARNVLRGLLEISSPA